MSDRDRDRDRSRDRSERPGDKKDTDNNDNKIYVGGLNFSATKADIHDAFKRAGKIANIQLVMDPETGRSKGFAFVTFETEDAYDYALDRMNNIEILGRSVRVNKALNSQEKAAQDRERGHDRHPTSDRDRYHGRDPPPRGYGDSHSARPSGPKPKGYRLNLTGLPSDFTWRELKDFLRNQTGSQPTYANIEKPGCGVGEFPTASERSSAVRMLDGLVYEGCKVRCEPQEDGARGGGRDYDTSYRGGGRDAGSGGGYDREGYGRSSDRPEPRSGGGGGYRDNGAREYDDRGKPDYPDRGARADYADRGRGEYADYGKGADYNDRYAPRSAEKYPAPAAKGPESAGRYEPSGYAGAGRDYDEPRRGGADKYAEPASRGGDYRSSRPVDGGRYGDDRYADDYHEPRTYPKEERYEPVGREAPRADLYSPGGRAAAPPGPGYSAREAPSREAGYERGGYERAPRDAGYERGGGGYAARDAGGRDPGYERGYGGGREPAYADEYRGGGGRAEGGARDPGYERGGGARPGSGRPAYDEGRGGPDRHYGAAGKSGYERTAPY